MKSIDKAAVLKTVRNIATTIGVLVVLIVGAGVGYTWYMGQQPAEEAVAPVATTQKAPISLAPTKPSADANVSASVQMLISPIAPGENTTISVKTLPGAVCTIAVKYNDVPSTDSGLKEKTADEYGIISWTWTVDASAPEGTWPVNVTCNANEKSAVVRGDLIVKR